MFGNLDSQTTIGKGLAGSRNITTGVSNAYGFCNEYSPDKESTSYAIKCFGIENLWGGANANNTYSLNTFLYGVNTNGNTKNISVIPFARANVREAYSYPSTVFGAWLTAPIGVSLFGFFQNMNIDTHGSAGTYFSDYVSLFSSADNQTYYYCVGRGVTNTVGEYGIFSLSQFIGGSSGSGSIVISSRLMYMRERII